MRGVRGYCARVTVRGRRQNEATRRRRNKRTFFSHSGLHGAPNTKEIRTVAQSMSRMDLVSAIVPVGRSRLGFVPFVSDVASAFDKRRHVRFATFARTTRSCNDNHFIMNELYFYKNVSGNVTKGGLNGKARSLQLLHHSEVDMKTRITRRY